MKRLRLLEEENGKLKRTVADLSLDKAMKPARQRQMVDHARWTWRVSIRRACRALPVERSTYHYRSRRAGQAQLTETDQGDRGDPRALWLSAHSCAAAPGRLAGQCQARVSAVSRYGPAIAPQDAQAPGEGQAAGGPPPGDTIQ